MGIIFAILIIGAMLLDLWCKKNKNRDFDEDL